jgi:Trm5-related predicted tRNA methylase
MGPKEFFAKRIENKLGACNIITNNCENIIQLGNRIWLGYGLTLPERDVHGTPLDEYLGITLLRKGKEKQVNYTLRKDGDIFIEKDLGDFPEGPEIIIDMRFFDKMLEKEKISCVNQIVYSYSFISKNYFLKKFKIVNYNEEFLRLYRTTNAPEKFLVGEFNEECIVLDPYAERELKEIENGRYLILGLVDRGNREKGISKKLAEEHGWERVRIGEGAKHILTIDQVVKYLVLLIKGIDYKEALLKVIPERKLNLFPIS